MKTTQLTYTAEVNWKSWLEWDLNSHLRNADPPLYRLNYRDHKDWRRVLANSILATT